MITRLNESLGRLGRSAGVPAAEWYDGAIAAYQPKGAASLAASYVNLANPGTYNAAPGVAPSFDAATGWGFTTTQFLITGVRMFQPYSVIMRYSGAIAPLSNQIPFGIVAVSPSTIIYQLIISSVTTLTFANGSANNITDVLSSAAGVAAISANKAYFNGADTLLDLGGAWAFDPNPSGGCYIGARNLNGSKNNGFTGNIQSFGIWPYTLTAQEVADKTALIQAL
jgi:hypothetical protein